MNNSDLENLRRDIDDLDRVILDAVSRRFQLTAQVAATKHDGHIFRPGREADLLKNLLDQHDNSLDPRLIETLWRQIIAFSLAGQKPLTIACAGGDGLVATARYRFGEAAFYQSMDDASSVFDAVASGKADLGVLPHWEDGTWWQELAARRGEGATLAIAAVTPLTKESSLQKSVVIAPHMPDASSQDMTICVENGQIVITPGYEPERSNVVGIFQQR